MKSLRAIAAVVAGTLLAFSASAEDQYIRLNECNLLTQQDFHDLAMYAFEKRGYNIEENTPTMIVGENDDLKVEILIEDNSQIVVRWKEGFGHRRDQWLRNLKTDILWRMAE